MKILVVLSRVPYPLTKGDKLRAFNQIKSLSKNNEIYLFCVAHQKKDKAAIEFLSTYCKRIEIARISFIEYTLNVFLAFIKGLPLQVGYFFSQRAKKRYLAFEQSVNPDCVYSQFIRTTEYTRNSSAFKVLDYQDALSTNLERRSKNAPFYLYPILVLEYKRLRKYESVVFDLFNEKVIISEADKTCIRHPQKEQIHVIPNGVDTQYFYPMPSIEKSFDLVFTGNMGYAPNINAATFLVKEILPLVLQKKPTVKVLITGANPSFSVLSLKSENVIVEGWVEDIRKSYAKAKIFIAPMQIGTGLQNKLLEAMAMQLPSITSELANRSLNAVNRESIIIAHTAEEYSNAILELLSNTELFDRVALSGYDYVCRTFSWEKYNAELERVITKRN